MSILNYFKKIPTESSVDESGAAPSNPSSSKSVVASGAVAAPSSTSSSKFAVSEEIGNASLPNDLGNKQPCQPKISFPLTHFGKQERAFSAKWYTGRHWLEYSIEKDAAFCFPCRKFSLSSSTGEYAFRMSGFRKWKVALEKCKGLMLHESSTDHIQAMRSWKEHQTRIESHQEVTTLLNETQLSKNRLYVTCILNILKFLSVNELPLRGDNEARLFFDSNCGDSVCPSGLFQHLFEYTLKIDKELAEIVKYIPKVATYTSPGIQNEAIAIMAAMVQEQVVEKIKAADVPFFTIKVDGTKDYTGKENISIVLRAVKEGRAFEHLVSIESTVELHADALSTVILSALEKLQLNPQHIISQCYDGAAVMSGKHGGVQKKLQERLKKIIPYVHCYNHQLHLVVVHAISQEPKVQQYFDICSALYNFTRKQTVAAIYSGTKLARLLEQRWDGHLKTTVAILVNMEAIEDLLKHCAEGEVSAEVAIEATGLLAKISEPLFKFLAEVIRTTLTILEPANNCLQSKTMDLLTASEVVDTVLQSIQCLRDETKFHEIFTSLNIEQNEEAPLPKKRRITLSTHLRNSIVMAPLPGCSRYEPLKVQFKGLYNGIVDSIVEEIRARFSDGNIALLKSLKALVDFDSTSSSVENLKYLSNLCNVDIVDAKEELSTATSFIHKKLSEKAFSGNLQEVTAFMYTYREAFPRVYHLLASGLTIGASTSSCEASFSTLNRILTPYRHSMLQERKANLILLAHEKVLTNEISSEGFLRCFNMQKNRRLQLW
jgi:hypothetical protein